MENASQALLMAAGVLIAVLIISLGVYLFNTSSSIGESYEYSVSQIEQEKLNSRFSIYSRKSYYGIITDGKVNKISETESETEIRNATEETINNYVCADFNTITDVVTAINQAYDINNKNQFDIQSSIQVTVKLPDNKIYGITPNSQKSLFNQKKIDKNIDDKSFIYGIPEGEESVKMDKDYSSNDRKQLNELLLLYSDSIINKEKKNVFKYIFDGEVHYNTETGLIDIVNFSWKNNKLYDKLAKLSEE